MQGNTQLVLLTPPANSPYKKPFKAVLKEMNSNQNVMGLHSLENERRVVELLTQKGFKHMPTYYLDLTIQSKYRKYAHHATMTLAQKDCCDARRSNCGASCEINRLWDACNGMRGFIDTTIDIEQKNKNKLSLSCPDSQLLAMEFLEGYKDLNGLQPSLKSETGFNREVRAAALFVAYDKLANLSISHCDFNPGNAMFKLDDPRVVKIIDWGLARTNDHPVGACRGNLEDIGTPGFLWLSLYRGGKDEADWAVNDRKAGPLSLSGGAEFYTPKGQKKMQPFSMKEYGAWNKNTRSNWVAIVSYARELLLEAGGEALDDSNEDPLGEKDLIPDNPKYTTDENSMKREIPVKTPTPTPDVKAEVIGQPLLSTPQNPGAPACSHIVVEKVTRVCKFTVYDSKTCTVKFQCEGKAELTKLEVSKDHFGSYELTDCKACKVAK